MTSQPSILLDLAQRLLETAPWDYIAERCVFLVAVPGRELPMTVTILGDTVDFNGVELLLEPDGFQRLAQLHDPDATDAEIEAYTPGRSLSAVFLPASDIPPDFKKVWKAAGFKSLGRALAPQFAAADEGGGVRPIKRSEGTLLAYAMHAILDSLDVETLSSPDISEGVRATLLVTVPGDDPEALENQQLPPTRAQIVPWPGEDGVVPEYSPLTKGAATRLRALPLDPAPLAAVLFPSAGATSKNVEEGQWVMLFLDPVAEELLGASTLESDTEDAREMALTAFLVDHGTRPHDLVVEGAGFALWAFGACEQLGIEGRYGQFLGPFAELLDQEITAHGGTTLLRGEADAAMAPWGKAPEEPLNEEPSTLEDWTRTHLAVSELLSLSTQDAELTGEIQNRYFGGTRAMERMVELMGSLGAEDAFWGYAVEDFRLSQHDDSVVDIMSLEGIGLTRGEVQDIVARRDGTVSLFACSADGAEVTDVLTNETFPVELDFGRLARFGDHVMVLRHYRIGGFHAFAPGGPPWTAESKEEFLEEITDLLGANPTHENLRAHGDRLGGAWSRFVQRLAPALEASRQQGD